MVKRVCFKGKKTRRGKQVYATIPDKGSPWNHSLSSSRNASNTPSSSGLHTPFEDHSPLANPQFSPPRRKSRSGKSQNDYLADWKPFKELYLDQLLQNEAPPYNRACSRCKEKDTLYRCMDCFANHTLCQRCCVEDHHHMPFHRIRRWSGNHFVSTSLYDLGFVLNLGHNGSPCPSETDDDIDDMDVDENLFAPEEDSKEQKMVLVNTNGVFVHRVKWCTCPEQPSSDIILLQMGLFPATLDKPKTAFTFQVLHYFHMDQMECKVSASNFFNKLRRITNPIFPNKVPNRYQELMRVSRQWRFLQVHMKFGYGHDTDKTPGNGDLAEFCPACPQPGVNLPDDWTDHPDQRIFRRSLVADGNFKADHMKMRRPDGDVSLMDGQGFFVEHGPYQKHLETAVELKRKPTCSNHRAANEVNSGRKNLDVTGVGACACARHGCFVPHSMVDFQKGEKQMNMDYSICQAGNYRTGDSNGRLNVLLIYDIVCQWAKEFKKRVSLCPGLERDTCQEWLFAIGKFHLAVHVKECFWTHSLNFMEGVGQLDGEIMETLWSPFNAFGRMTRSMGIAQRKEILDDYMRDANFQKLVGMVKMLLNKRKTAIQGFDITNENFQELSENLPAKTREQWLKEEQVELRVNNSFRIYDVDLEKAPSQAIIQQELAEAESKNGLVSGSIAWLSSGLDIELQQHALQLRKHSLRKRSTLAERGKIQESRRRLHLKIVSFNNNADQFLGKVDLDLMQEEKIPSEDYDSADEGIINSDSEESTTDDEEGSEEEWEEDEAEWPEDLALVIPSRLGAEECRRLGLVELMEQEIKLREGQANDALEELRTALAEKSLLYRTKIRGQPSQKMSTRSWNGLKRANGRVQKHVRKYDLARVALLRMAANIPQLKPMTKEDLKMPADVTEENRFGQRRDTLAWFWRMGPKREDEEGSWMNEFYRVNWLRAKSRVERWREELTLVNHEMSWTLNFYQKRQQEWESRARKSEEAGAIGHACYAWEQQQIWNELAQDAKILLAPL